LIQEKNLPREFAHGSMVFAADESAPPWHVIRGMVALRPVTGAKPRPPALLHKLAWAVIVKLLLLTAIWFGFLADQKVEVDAEQASSHLLMRPTTDASKEMGHDF
jgi:hypothetical protein